MKVIAIKFMVWLVVCLGATLILKRPFDNEPGGMVGCFVEPAKSTI